MDFLIFPAKTGAKKKKQKTGRKKRNSSARFQTGLDQPISQLEEDKSDEGEVDHDEISVKYEISRQPGVPDVAGGDDDGEFESEFVSVVRTKKKKNKRKFQPEPEMPSFRSERSLSSPGSSSASEDRVGYNVTMLHPPPPTSRDGLTESTMG